MMAWLDVWIKVVVVGTLAMAGFGMSLTIWGLYQTVPLVAVLIVFLLISPFVVAFGESIYKRVKTKGVDR